MPRPKRTKVASTAAQPTRVAVTPKLATTTASRLNAPRVSSEHTDEVSDDSQGFVKTVKGPPRGRRGAQRPSDTVKMTGALGEGAVKNARKANTRPRQLVKKVAQDPGQTNALDALRKRRDEALRAKGAQAGVSSPAQVQQTPRAEPQREPVIQVSSAATSDTEDLYAMPAPRPAQKTPQTQAAPVAPMNRIEAPSTTTRTVQRITKTSSPHGPPIPLSAAKPQSTPGPETSVLALANFRRRPRQPSILRMVEQHNDDEDDTLGDFNPDDESTPVGTRKVTVPSSAVAGTPEEARTSSSRKRKHSSLEPDSEIQVLRSSPPLISPPIGGRDEDSAHESSSLPDRMPDTQEAPTTHETEQAPEIWSETMAPPESSSPSHRSQELRKHDAPPARRRGRPPRARTADHSDLSDAEDAATTPARPKRNAQPIPKKAPALTTAALASLLPQRRRKPRDARAKSPFEIPSSSDIAMVDTDEDELQQAPARRGRGKAPTKTAARTPKKGGGAGKLKSASPLSARKGGAGRPATTTPAAATRRTYTRRPRPTSDQENNNGDSSGLSEPPSGSESQGEGDTTVVEIVSKSKELAAAKQKFEEVDQWEMEFESADLIGGESSPWR
ncbi:hypothetical protein W97_07503 [Coniosporium apollinis CBS 100218]|uniref:Uncharacterized protein n=1 Tax=Coniosporium apollinis (strain CBS 100218) TaxID=1168221 RepID=R7Z224_CONA1|nr:uncharacterized protein W97_07503 [Coniosporium apollinis CBS 100218]EON68245.1 hypothetical protein W97_07503 [Coniosporium apollinis CBS 100218]